MNTLARLLLLMTLALLPLVSAHAQVTYVYTDPQGTPLAEADANGNITATFDYAPYGSQALGTAPSGPGYTGHVNDPETGFVYMQARYYDPGVGRFLSLDPIVFAAGNTFNFSRYVYASNNPIFNIDPDGRADAPAFMERLFPKGDLFRVAGTAVAADAAYIKGAITGDEALKSAAIAGMREDVAGHGGGQAILTLVTMGKEGVVEGAGGELHAPGDVPGSQVIVRGGATDMPAPGQVFSGSQGSSVADAAKGVPHGQIRTSTADAIRANGGTVDVAPEPTRSGQINGQHVNVTEGGTASTFSNPPQPNPVPKPDRIQ